MHHKNGYHARFFVVLEIAGVSCAVSRTLRFSFWWRAGYLRAQRFGHQLVVVNGEATATYATPKASLLASGIQEGSVVFKGFEEGNRISGTAYTYRKGCAPAPYEVVGYFSGNNIVLFASAGKGRLWRAELHAG